MSGQAAIFGDDIYLRTDLIEAILPLRLRADVNAQTLTVIPTIPLPFQERLAREQRAAQIGLGDSAVVAAVVETPYRLFSPPAFDVNLGGQIARDGSDQSRSYDVRMAGDLLYTGFQGFIGSDQDGQLNTARVLFERKDPQGHALGPLGATRAGIGDVFTPSMSLGAGGVGGRGAYYTSAPLEALDLSTPLDLRGELPLGEDVELYVNEVLQATQASADRGRYEFLDVPLTFGLNTIRLVFYGPQGQTRQQVRRVNFGTGQVASGRFVLRMGAVEQDTPVVQLGDPIAGPADRRRATVRPVRLWRVADLHAERRSGPVHTAGSQRSGPCPIRRADVDRRLRQPDRRRPGRPGWQRGQPGSGRPAVRHLARGAALGIRRGFH